MNLIKYSAHLLNLSHHTWFYSLTKYDILQAYFLFLSPPSTHHTLEYDKENNPLHNA